jgi:tetratricopeptide (TPR) repeat protein/predicted Ser/Thr protein kinase
MGASPVSILLAAVAPPVAAVGAAAVVILSIVAVALVVLALGLVVFVGRGRLYERWLRWRVSRGHVEEAIAWYRSKQRFEEAGRLMVGIGDVAGAARLYVRNGKPELAAEIYEAAGDLAQAAAHWLHARDPDRAADCYRRLGDAERAARVLGEAGEFGAAADVWLQAGELARAVAVLEEAGLYDRAAALLVDHDRPEEAGDLLARAGLFRKAAPLYHKAGALVKAAIALERDDRSEDAARLLLEEGEPLLAAKIHARAGRFAEAARLFGEHGAPEKAAEALLAGGDPAGAAAVFEGIGDEARAAELYERAGQPREAASLRAATADRRGEYEQSAEHYLRTGRLDEAVDRFRRAGRPDRAGQALVAAGRPAEGAALLVEGGRLADAASAWEKAGRDRDAAQCWLKAGRIAEALGCLRRIGDRLTIARVHNKLGDTAAALVVLAEVPPRDPHGGEAALMRARLLERAGDVTAARDVLQAFLAVRGLSAETIPLALRLAEYEVRLGNAGAAIERLRALRASGLAPPGFDEQFDYFQASVLAVAPAAGHAASPSGAAAAPPAGAASRRDRSGRRPSTGDPHAASLARASSLRHATITMGFPWIGRYRFLDKLGAGSFGEVYRAHDTSLDRVVALKILLGGDMPSETARALFLKEARVVAKLNHPNIITVYDIGEFGGSVYIAMEYIDGENLADIMERRSAPLPLNAVASITRQIAEALDYAHGHNVVHRDIKLENAMITPEGRLKILDFGVASVLDDPREEGGIMAGTPHYMAPELITQGHFDGRTDLYALGVLLYALSTARFPFQDSNVLEAQRLELPPDPLLHNPDLPRAFGDVVLRLLEKNPDDRFQNAAELLRTLHRVVGAA